MGVGIKLGVLDEVRLADQLAQLGEVMVAGHGNDHIGVLAHVDVEGGTEGVAGTHTGGVDTADGVADHVGLHKGEHAVQQGHVHILAFAGALPVIQGQQDAGDGVQAGTHVAQGSAYSGGRGIGIAGDAHHAGHALGHDVIGGQVAHGAVLAEAGDGAVDDLGVDLLQILVGEAQLLHHAGLEVLHHDVAGLDHIIDQVLALFQVDGDALLAPVDQGVVAALPIFEGAKDTAAVAHAGLFDLDDFRAEVGQVHGTERAGQHLGKVKDSHALKCFFHDITSQKKSVSIKAFPFRPAV